MPQPGHDNTVAPHPKQGGRQTENPTVNLVLFLLTICTVTFVYFFEWSSPGLTARELLIESFVFACALISILLTHELGHYLAARYHNIDATLPYFIPAPIGIGTFGALIKMKQKIATRNQLLDIGASGPIAGFLVAFAIGIAGIYRSQVTPLPEKGIQLGDSLLFKAIIYVVHGTRAQGMDLTINPLILAAWFGFFVTSLNLIPASQLDGGHIIYSIIGKKHRIISRMVFVSCITWGVWGDIAAAGIYAVPTAVLLTGFAIYLSFIKKPRKLFGRLLMALIAAHLAIILNLDFYPQTLMWLFWAGLIFVFFKLDHPPVIEDVMTQFDDKKPELDMRRKIVGVACIIIFLLTFLPMPVKILM